MAPKASGSAASSTAEHHQKVKAACEECRTRKIKCDARRPICSSCEKKNKDCVYATEPDELRITALKRRYAELCQATSNNDALIHLLRETPLDEAQSILNRIRAHESILSILTSNGGANSPENNLMLAIQNTGSDDAVDDAATSLHSHQAQPSQVRTHAGPSNAPISKQSIAFLVGATSDTPTSTSDSSNSSPPSRSIDQEAQQTSQSGSTSTSSFETRRPSSPARAQTLSSIEARTSNDEHQTDKRQRPPKYPRGGATRHTWSGPAPFRRKGHTKNDASVVSTPNSDKTWMKGLDGVKAADWEVYYTDDETFLEVLKCYFVWENPALGLVDEKSFWKGLIARGSEFCNLSLVHAILALGAKAYGMFVPEKAFSVAQSALAETTRLWDWDADATVPANISSGLLLHAILASNAQDVAGAPYFAGAMRLAERSSLFSEDRVPQTYPESDSTLATRRKLFAWNVYSYYCMHALSFHDEPLPRPGPPRVEIVPIEQEEDSKEWTPFPIQSPSRSCLISSTCNVRAKLWRIADKIVLAQESQEKDKNYKSRFQDAMKLFHELQRWRAGLPPRQSIIHGAPPHVLSIHTDYHRCVIELFRPFIAYESTQDNFSFSHEQIRQSRLQLRLLIHQFELEFPNLPVSYYTLTTSLVSVANGTLPAMKNKPEQSDECFYFCLCMKQMKRMVEVYPLARYLIIGFAQMAQRQGVELPPDAKDILQSVRSGTDPSLVPSSRFPLQLDFGSTDLWASSLQTLFEESQNTAAESQ